MMLVKKVLMVVFVAAFVAAPGLSQTQNSGKKEEAKQQQVKASAAGDWDLSVEIPDGKLPVSASFKQSGEVVTGTMSSAIAPKPMEITDGKVVGDAATFSVMVPDDDGNFKATFSGRIAGDAIEGRVDSGKGSFPFKGTRKNPASEKK